MLPLSRLWFIALTMMISSPTHFSANAMLSPLPPNKILHGCVCLPYPLTCDGYLGWFRFLAVMNSEAINTDMQASLCVLIEIP